MAPKQNWRPSFPTNRAFFCWYLITSAVFIYFAINKNRVTILKKIQYFLLFAIINIPQKYISLGRYIFFYLFLEKKNLNKRLTIGLRKIYSVYKIGDSFMAFLLIIIFLLLMAAISVFFRDCDIMADTSDNFDTFLGPLSFSQRKVL